MANTVVDLVYTGTTGVYNSQEGAQFDIIVTGTFTSFVILLNGKTLTYTENCTGETITIDNVNMTIMNGSTNKISKMTGDFLHLNESANQIDITVNGGSASFQIIYREMYL
jgi:hypothetical protein